MEQFPLSWSNHLAAIKGKFFPAAVALGFLGLLFPSQESLSAFVLFRMALVEELVFRFLLQEQLEKYNFHSFQLPSLAAISYANIIASLTFALIHLLTQSPIDALTTFFPSLIFGFFWSKYRAIGICVSLHFFYNLMFFA